MVNLLVNNLLIKLSSVLLSNILCNGKNEKPTRYS